MNIKLNLTAIAMWICLSAFGALSYFVKDAFTEIPVHAHDITELKVQMAGVQGSTQGVVALQVDVGILKANMAELLRITRQCNFKKSKQGE